MDCVEVTKLFYQRILEPVESLLIELHVKLVSKGGKKTIPESQRPYRKQCVVIARHV